MNFIELKSGSTVEEDKIIVYKTEQKSSKYIYLIAGIHGDEVEGVYVLQNLFEWLKDIHDYEVNFIIIPILNIDGYRTATRTNSHGVDLDRNFPSSRWSSSFIKKHNFPGGSAGSEPEIKFISKLFDKHTPKLIFSFHSRKPAISSLGDALGVAENLNLHNSYPINEQLVDDVAPGSLSDYALERYKCPTICYECPRLSDDVSLKNIWEENKDALERIILSGQLK